MEIPPDVIAAKEALGRPLLEAGLITGIDFGVRNEQEPDPEDIALRIFVADENAVPPEVQAMIESFPFPVVVIQRVFRLTHAALPDTQRHRPVVGGVSVAASRFFATGTIHAGTLGAVVSDGFDPDIQYGLSNYHVLCVDVQRQVGDEIVQPEPSVLGMIPGDRVGRLHRFSFPETSIEGVADAAICELEVDSLHEVQDIGPVAGRIAATPGMQVTKRGRTTGQTFGIVTGVQGDYPIEYPQLPMVKTSSGGNTTTRILTNQIHIRVDFPSSIVFGEHGDSGSVVVGPNGQVVGLYWASGSDSAGDPLRYGVATPIDVIESELNITF